MKEHIMRNTVTALSAVLALSLSPFANAAGPLAPPGPPAPLFKTLQEVEPRTPISSLPFVINQPGSYYVISNLVGAAGQNGITINSDCVTLDLMGFEVRGVAGSLSGILLNVGFRAYIYNGCIRAWGQDGIDGINGAASVLERLRVGNNGRNGIVINSGSQVRQCVVSANTQVGILTSNDVEVDDCVSGSNGIHGIQVGTGSSVRRCLTSGNSASGITGSGLNGLNISECNADNNGGAGIAGIGQTIVKDCFARSNSVAGITVGDGSSVIGCNANDTGTAATPNAHGITVGGGSTVRDCTTRNNGGDGIQASFGCTVVNNSCRDNLGDNIQVSQECLVSQNACDDDTVNLGQSGIHVVGNNNRIDNNTLTETIRGLWITSAGNVVLNNSVLRNTTNYVIVAGNQLNLLLGQIPQAIPWPAVVKLAGSLNGVGAQNGVTITSDDVTIDLDGHSLIGVAGSLDGILVTGTRTNIVVRNGAVRRWGSDGVDTASAVNSSVTDVNVSNNGGRGIALGAGGAVKFSNARANTGAGIVISTGSRVLDSSSSENGGIGIDMSTGSSATGCAAFNNGGVGIDASTGCTVSRCTSYSNTGIGINASAATTVDNCAVSSNSTNGIVGSNGAKITGCAVRANGGNGIVVSSDAYVFNNQVDGHTGDAGIFVTGSDNRVDSNNCSDNTRGVDVDAAGNLIVRNSVSGATTAYPIVAGNSVGPILGVANPIVSNNPWANFSF